MANLVTTFTPQAIRNDFAGYVGFKFTTGATSFVINGVGRWMNAGNGAVHSVVVVRAVDNVTVASANVNMAGGAVGGFIYASLNASVTLAANTDYYLLSAETSAGDTWSDDIPALNITVNSSYATAVGSAYSSGTSLTAIVIGSAGLHSYAGVDLQIGVPSGDTVWVEDTLPAGATAVADVDGWNWIGSNPTPYSGTLAHQSLILANTHQHYFQDATGTLAVGTGEKLFCYIYLDPVNTPTEVMLQWNDGSGLSPWEHRAYWGANSIPSGTDGTNSRRYIGPLPATGQWVRLEVPASQVGLEGATLSGMAYTLYGGRATWDRAGKSAAGVAQVLTSIVVSPTAASIAVGATQTFTATAYDAAGAAMTTQPTFTWASSSTANATINSSGVATGVAVGNSNVTAASGSVTSTARVLTVTSAPDTTPPVISNISSGTPTTSGATITWTTDELATSRVYYDTISRPSDTDGSSYAYSSPVDTTADNTSHSIALSSLTASTVYYYKIRSADASGNIRFSTQGTFTTASGATVPTAPVQNAAAPGDGQVALSWNGAAGALSYKVFRSTTSGSYNYASPLASNVTSLNYTDTAATNGTPYYYVIRATNAVGDSASSNQQAATPTSSAPVLDHINVSPSPASIVTGLTRQFSATGLSASNQTVTGITFAWRSSNTLAVTINATTGLATAAASGTASVFARDPATGIESSGAVVTVSDPVVFGTILRREHGLSWPEIPFYGQVNYSRNIFAVNKSGFRSAAKNVTFAMPYPTAVTSLAGAYNNVNLTWTWNSSGNPDYYSIRRGGTEIDRVSGNAYTDKIVYGQLNYSLSVVAVSRAGLESSATSSTFTMPTPSVPSGFSLQFDGSSDLPFLLQRWVSIPNIEYDLSADGASIYLHIKSGAFDEQLTTLSSRTVVRYIRAINNAGIPSLYVSQTIIIAAPVAPVIFVDPPSMPNGVFKNLHVTTTTPRSQIKWTVIQTRSSGGTFPTSTATGTVNQQRIKGAPEEVTIPGGAGGNLDVRILHEDSFTATLNDGIWSAVLGLTFLAFLDGALDPNSDFLQKSSVRDPIISGGGQFALSTASPSVLTSTAAIIITGVSGTVSSNNTITIPALNVSLAVGSLAYARITMSSTTTAGVVVSVTSGAMPVETSGQYNIPLAQRGADGTVKLYDGRYIHAGEVLDAGTVIPRLTTFEANIGVAVITKANIKDIYADTIVNRDLTTEILNFGKSIGSKNYVPQGSSLTQTEAVAYDQTTAVNYSFNADGSVYMNVGASDGLDANAIATRAIHHGDFSVKLTLPTGYHRLALNWRSKAAAYPGGNYSLYPRSDGYYVHQDGVFIIALGSAVQTGDIAEIACEAGVVKAYMTRAGSRTLLYTFGNAPKYPLVATIESATPNANVQPLQITGILTNAIGIKPHYQNNVGVGFDANDSPYRSLAGSDWSSAGIFSVPSDGLAAGQDGHVEFVLPSILPASQSFMIGLSATDPNQNYTSILFAAQAVNNGNFDLYQSGVYQGSLGSQSAGAVVSIGRENGVITYRLNGIKSNISGPAYSGALYIDTSFYNLSQANAIGNIRLHKAGSKGQGVIIPSTGQVEIYGSVKLGETTVDDTMARLLNAIGANRRYRGNDTDVVPRHKITGAKLVKQTVNEDGNVDVILSLTLPAAGADSYANCDSISRVRIQVQNQFNEIIAEPDPLPYQAGGGQLPVFSHTRDYADAEFQAIYVISIENYYSWNSPVYFKAGILSLDTPTKVNKMNVPLEMNAASPLANIIDIGWKDPIIPNGAVLTTVQFRRFGDKIWSSAPNSSGQSTELHSNNVLINASTLYDIRLANANVAGAYSRVVRVRTREIEQNGAVLTPVGMFIKFNASNQPVLTWRNTSTYGFSLIRYDFDNGTTTVATHALDASSTTVDAFPPAAGQRVTYQIQNWSADSGTSKTGFSNSVSIIIPVITSTDPTGLTATLVSTSRIDLLWAVNANTTNTVFVDWKVAINADGTVANNNNASWPNAGIVLAANTTTFSDTTRVVPGAVMAYRIRLGGTLSASNILKVTAAAPPAKDDRRPL